MKNLIFNANLAKDTADNVNIDKLDDQLEIIIQLIQEEASKGNYQTTYDGSILSDNLKLLKYRGFVIEIGGKPNEISNCIKWDKPTEAPLKAPEKKCFYKDGIIGQGLMSEEAYKDYVNSLIEKFENVSWGGEDSFATNFTDVVVVYEAGVRGPSDWFYLNKEHKWAHGGYTAYKETYTNAEFLVYITKTLEQNKKYEKLVNKQESEKK